MHTEFFFFEQFRSTDRSIDSNLNIVPAQILINLMKPLRVALKPQVRIKRLGQKKHQGQ